MACKITDFMKPEWIIPELTAIDKESVLSEIAMVLSQSVPSLDEADLLAKLIERERKASTGADLGVAIPHATVDSAQQMMVVFGKSSKGIPFNALDSEDSKLFFAIISPSRSKPSDVSYLQLISFVCRLMRSAHLRQRLIAARTPEEILNHLRNEENQKLSQPVSTAP